jgi:hypothetical protein
MSIWKSIKTYAWWDYRIKAVKGRKMTRYKSTFCSFVAALGLFALLSMQNSKASDLAVVTNVTGTPRINGHALKQFNLLDGAPQKIELADGATAAIFFFDDVREETLTGPGTFQVVRTRLIKTSKTGTISIQKKDPAFGNVALKQKDGGVQAGVIVRGENIATETPADGEVIDPADFQMSWMQRAHTGAYSVLLTEDKPDREKAVFTGEIDKAPFSIPDGIQLKPGLAYRWELRWRDMAGVLRVATNRFSVADAQVLNQIHRLRPGQNSTASERVLYGLWLRSIGMSSLSAPYLDQ